MNTDRELLELAAKAAEIQIEWHRWPSTAREAAYVPNGDVSEQHGACYLPWNPLTNDGDAFRLLIDLRLIVTQYSAGLTVHQFGPVLATTYYKDFDGDRRAAARRAITLAAAAIATTTKEAP